MYCFYYDMYYRNNQRVLIYSQASPLKILRMSHTLMMRNQNSVNDLKH